MASSSFGSGIARDRSVLARLLLTVLVVGVVAGVGFGLTSVTTRDSAAAAPLLPFPVVTGVSPSSGPTAGGTIVTITGTDFTTTAPGDHVITVTFGGEGMDALSFTVNSASSITAVTPPGTGTVNVQVVRSDGADNAVGGAGDQFTYVDAPTLDDLRALVNSGVTKASTAKNLLAKLDAVAAALAAGDNCSALNQLQAFKNMVDAQSGKDISPAVADQLDADAVLISRQAPCQHSTVVGRIKLIR